MISQVCEAESRICEVQSAGRKLRLPVHSRRKKEKVDKSNIRFKKQRTDPARNKCELAVPDARYALQ